MRLKPRTPAAGVAAVAAWVAVALLAAPTASAQETPSGEADLLLRFPSQQTFRVWGDGNWSNEFRVEAAPGDVLETHLLVKVRGGDNTLDGPANFTAHVDLERRNGTVRLASTNGTIGAGASGPVELVVNVTVPADLAVGTYTLWFSLETGPWDPNEDNNAPPIPQGGTALVIGRATIDDAVWDLSTPYLIGPLVFVGLVALPFAGRALRDRDAWRSAREGLATRRHDLTVWWVHLPALRRRRIGLTAAAGAFLLLFAVMVAVHRSVAFGLSGLGDALILAVVASLVHIAGGTVARYRSYQKRMRQEGHALDDVGVPWSRLVRETAGATLQVALVVTAIALFWQQLAAVSRFFRWPDFHTGQAFGGLTPFALIGIATGAIYALIALGYTMVYGILKFINFAHGEVFMWGAYFAWLFAVEYGNIPLTVALLISVILTGMLGAGIERVAYRPLRGGSRLTPLVTAIALSLLLQSAAQFFFSAKTKSFQMRGSSYVGSGLERLLSQEWPFLGTFVDGLDIAVLVLSIGLMAGLHLFVRYSKMGQAMRAVSDDMDTARTIGINVDRTITWTFVIGSALAAVGGVLFGLAFSTIRPTMGLFVGIKAFTAAVVGGIGNIYGAFLGGFLIGLAEAVGGQFILPEFQRAITFVILVVFLLWRPQGIFGEEEDARR